MSEPRFYVLTVEYELESEDELFRVTSVVGVYTSFKTAQDAAQSVIEGEIKWCHIWEQQPYHMEDCNTGDDMRFQDSRAWFVQINGFLLDEMPLETIGHIL